MRGVIGDEVPSPSAGSGSATAAGGGAACTAGAPGSAGLPRAIDRSRRRLCGAGIDTLRRSVVAGAIAPGAAAAVGTPGAVAGGATPAAVAAEAAPAAGGAAAEGAGGRGRGVGGGDGGGAVRSSGIACCGGSGFSCAPTSKISPGPGWIFVVGERGAACVNSLESSSSDTSLPALADSPRSVSSRCPSFPRTLRSSSCVSHVSSGSRCVMSSSA